MPYTLSQNEMDAIGGMSTAQGGQMNAYNPAMATVTTPAPSPQPTASTPAAPAPVTTPAPTIGETLTGIKSEALRIQDLLNKRNTSNFSTSPLGTTEPEYTPFDYDQELKRAQKNQLKMFQAEINATNKVYDNMLSNARVQGLGRLGSQRAISARSGLLGSDFDASNTQNVTDLNNREQSAIGAQRTAAIGNIMGNVRKAAVEELDAKRLARTQGAEEYRDYLARKSERKSQYTTQIVTDMLAQGFDIGQFSTQELDEFGKEAGISAKDLIAAYTREKATKDAEKAETDLKTRKTEAEIDKLDADTANAGFFNLSEGQSRYDANGNLIASKGKTYAPDTGGSLGNFSSKSVSDAAQALEETRGSDNYANTGVYLDLYEQAVANDVLPQDFIKKFPPDLYLNPDDPSIPAFIKNDMMEVDLFGSF
jgi:hypothetical protein